MKGNVGKIDRVFRVVIGMGMLAAGVYFQSWWGAVGILPIFTATISWCPVYLPFGISSIKNEST
jgi:hypothetical protein